LSRRLAEAGTAYRIHLPDQDLLEAMEEVSHISTHGRAAGHRVLQAALSAWAGLRVTRAAILEASRAQDPAGLQARQERIIHWQEYTVTEPMQIWHIDCEYNFTI
jgi:hypothetical protein